MSYSKLIVAWIYIPVLVFSSKYLPKDERFCPGALQRLEELIIVDDDPKGIREVIGFSCPLSFSRETDALLKNIIKLNRVKSFELLFPAMKLNYEAGNGAWEYSASQLYASELFQYALTEHRPEICKFLLTSTDNVLIVRSSRFSFWKQKPFLWTLYELKELFPPSSKHLADMIACADLMRECTCAEECIPAIEFNSYAMNAIVKQGRYHEICQMLRVLLLNEFLPDEDMAILVRRLTKGG